MAEKENVSKKFRYNDEDERYRSLNKFYFIGMNALYVMFAAYLLMRATFGDLNKLFAYVNLAIVVVFEIVNIVSFIRDKAGRKYSVISVVLGGIELFLLGGNKMHNLYIMLLLLCLCCKFLTLFQKDLGKCVLLLLSRSYL